MILLCYIQLRINIAVKFFENKAEISMIRPNFAETELYSNKVKKVVFKPSYRKFFCTVSSGLKIVFNIDDHNEQQTRVSGAT